MSNIIHFDRYTGRFEYDDEFELFHGTVLGLNDVITFQGKSVNELKKAMRDSIREYERFCAKIGKKPEKPYSGKFTVRIPSDLHRTIHIQAQASGKSLNEFVMDILQNKSES